MDLDKQIDKYINDEKKIKPSPFLQNRIMANLEEKNSHRSISMWQPIAVAASIAAVVVSGWLIGSSYNTSTNNNNLVVNDSQIENFLILTDDADQ